MSLCSNTEGKRRPPAKPSDCMLLHAYCKQDNTEEHRVWLVITGVILTNFCSPLTDFMEDEENNMLLVTSFKHMCKKTSVFTLKFSIACNSGALSFPQQRSGCSPCYRRLHIAATAYVFISLLLICVQDR
jgi:hypothetical protein